MLFDSTYSGGETEPDNQLRIELEPGRYAVRAAYVKPDQETWVCLVRLNR